MTHADRIPEILQQYAGAEFKWGVLDCCLFAAAVVKELTGVDYAESWRGRYKSHMGALRMIAKHGSLESLVSSVCGEPVPPLLARRGAFVLAGMPEGDAVGIADGDGAVFLAERGLIRVPLKHCKVAWNV